MFHDSTQKKFWLLSSSEKIVEAQTKANGKYIDKFKSRVSGGQLPEFLAYHEERLFLIYYSHWVIDVCRKFQPPVPLSVIGTAMSYFKRFFLNTSVMEFHPRDVVYLCVYLSCKVEEYNISIDQFMGQVAAEEPYIAWFVIDNELLLLQKLHFHITVHNPYRPVEGFIIDMKTKKEKLDLPDIEPFRPKIENILTRALLTDVCLLFTPSQIALTALRCCIGKPVDNYIRHITPSKLHASFFEKLSLIQDFLVNFKFPSKDEIKVIEQKLGKCRDFEHDPKSDFYHARDKKRQEEKHASKSKRYQELANIEKYEHDLLPLMD